MLAEFSVNAVGALRVVEAFLRCSIAASSKGCASFRPSGEHWRQHANRLVRLLHVQAALNIAVKNLSNDLSPQGFSFRLYHPGWLRTYLRGLRILMPTWNPKRQRHSPTLLPRSPQSEGPQLHDWEGADLPW